MRVFEQFNKIYCINLEHRKDRKASAEDEFEKYGIEPVQFVKATDGVKLGMKSIYTNITPGALGAYHSHLNLLKDAYANNFESILIFEDDVRFEPGFQDYFEEQFASVPDDWNFLYLGWADFQGFSQANKNMVNEWVCKPVEPYGLFAYAIKGHQFIQELIDFFERRIDTIQRQYDEYLCYELWPDCNFKMYALTPPLIWYKSMGTDIQTQNQERHDGN